MRWWTWLVGVLGFVVGAALGGKSGSQAGRPGRRAAEDAAGGPKADLPPAPDHHLPSPSIWPAVLAAGLALTALGVPTSYAFTGVGALVVAWALNGWIGELRRGL